jgi:hypothetical protein
MKSKVKGPDGEDMKGYKVKQLKVLTPADAAKAKMAKDTLKSKKDAPALKKAHADTKKKTDRK